jgi:peroxin-14
MTFSGNHHHSLYHNPLSTMSFSSRQDLIQNAILFLQDPKTQSSPLTSKIEFLQAKGLDEQEIQEALSRSSSSSSSTNHSSTAQAPYRRDREEGYGGMKFEMAPVPPKRDWRDMFVCPKTYFIAFGKS